MQSIGKILAGLLAAAAFLTCASAQAQQTLVVNSRHLDVLVDVDVCGQVAAMCTDSGSVGPAADGNDSVVSIHVYVKEPSGVPVTGLLDIDFAMFAVTNAGGTPTFIGPPFCPGCFAEPDPGIYRLAVRPGGGGNWSAGSYVVLIEVTYPTGAIRSVAVPIDIPS